MKFFTRIMCLVMVMLIVPITASAVPFEGLTIVKIDLKGNVNTDSTLIKAQLSSKEHYKFKLATVSKDVKDLYLLGFFSDIKVDAKRMGRGVVLTYIFKEFEKVEKIIIKGNDELSQSTVKEIMTIKKDSVYSLTLLNKNIENIIKKYKKEGYINAKIKHSIKMNRKTRKVSILLNINEGKKIVIEKIIIVGAKQLDSGSVKGAIEDTHESGFFRSGILDEKSLEKDKKRIEKYYHDRGFINMKILSVNRVVRKIKPNKPEKAIFLYIKVYEGQRYKLNQITIQGNRVFKTDKILKNVFQLKKGNFFNETQYQKDIFTIRRIYQERGYIFSSIVPIKNIDKRNLQVNISIKIYESEKAHVENIKVKGALRTKNYVIDREIRLKEGEVFNRNKIVRSQERLYHLRFFKDVNIDIEPGSTEGLMNLIFSLKEDRTGMITLGAGYGTASGMSGYLQIQEINFLGEALKIHARGELGQKRNRIEIGFDNPWLLKYSPTSLGISLSYNDYNNTTISESLINTNVSEHMKGDGYSYNQKSFQLQFRLGRTVSEYWRVFGSYTFATKRNSDENFVLFTEEEATAQGNPYLEDINELEDFLTRSWYQTSSVRIGAVMDSRNDSIAPSSGSLFRQFLTYTGGFLGGYSQFIESVSDLSIYFPLPANFVLAINGKVGFLFDQFDRNANIDAIDKLQFDGMTELRGWNEEYEATGRGKVGASVEIRYPLSKRVLSSVLFCDMGKIWSDWKQVSFNLKEFKYSIGFGFRLEIPMLPIRLYMAKRFDYDESGVFRWSKDGDDGFFRKWEFVFSVAGLF